MQKILISIPILLLALTVSFCQSDGSGSASEAKELELGAKMPSFELKNPVTGEMVKSDSVKGEKLTLVGFTCNHCPLAKGWEERFVQYTADYKNQGVSVVMINPNALTHEGDTEELMVERVKAKNFNFPYLSDPTQEVTKKYGAKVTPHLYLFHKDKGLIFKGAMDDNYEDANAVTKNYLIDATDNAIQGKEIKLTPEMKAKGCSIKWADKKKDSEKKTT